MPNPAAGHMRRMSTYESKLGTDNGPSGECQEVTGSMGQCGLAVKTLQNCVKVVKVHRQTPHF